MGGLRQERAVGIKMGDDGCGGTDSPDGVVSSGIVGASASVMFPCNIESRRWRAVMEDVDKGCSEFCVTVGTIRYEMLF